MINKSPKQRMTFHERKYDITQFPPFNSAVVARTAEILADTATEVWTGQLELLRLEAELATRSPLPLHANGVENAKLEQWQDSADKIIAQMRKVGDSVRDCNWKLFDLYSQSALKAFSQASDRAEQ